MQNFAFQTIPRPFAVGVRLPSAMVLSLSLPSLSLSLSIKQNMLSSFRPCSNRTTPRFSLFVSVFSAPDMRVNVKGANYPLEKKLFPADWQLARPSIRNIWDYPSVFSFCLNWPMTSSPGNGKCERRQTAGATCLFVSQLIDAHF